MQHLGLAAGAAGRSQVVGSPVRTTHHQATPIHLWPHSPQRLAGQYGRLLAVAQSGGSTGQSSSDVAGLLSAVFQPTQAPPVANMPHLLMPTDPVQRLLPMQRGGPAYPHLLYPASENAASSGSSMQPAAQSALSNSASSAASAAPQSPAGTILQQWLQQDSDGTAQEDPIQAARRLQNFLAQYAGQYDVQTDERITVASDRLQAFIDRHGTAANNIFKDAAATAVEGAAAAPAYQAHLAQPLGSLDWASQSATLGRQQQLGPIASSAASSMGIGREDGGQAEQLGEAANTLRGLVGQLTEARDMYGSSADPQEQAALTAMLAPLQALADRLSSAATLTPMSTPPQNMASGILTDMIGNAAGMGGPDGAAGAQQQHNDPMLGVVEGLNGALVVDSGLRDFAVAVRSLGESLAAQMSGAWSVAPTLARVVAYIAAVAGVLLVMRTRVPALMAARDPITGQVLSGRDRTQSSLDSRTRTQTGSGSSSNSRTPEVLPPLPAGLGAFSRRAVSPLAAMDKDSGLGDTRLPSEILATDPYAARKVVYDTSIDVPAAASISSGSGRMAAGPALTVAGAAAAYAAEAKPGVRMKSLDAPPDRQPAAAPVAGNWGGVPSDRRDWWRLGAGKASAGSSSNDDSSTSRSNTRAGAGGSALGNDSSAGGMWGNASRGFGNGNGSSGPGQGAGMRESAYALAASGSAGTGAYVAPVSYYASSGSGSMLSGGGVGVDGTWRATPLRGSAPSQTATWEQQQQQALAQQPPADVMAPPQIKAQLLQVVLTLSPLAAVLPGAGGPSGEVARGRADALLAALEALPSPVVRPLVDTMGMSRQPNVPIQYGADARLLGDWRLIYASSGEEYSTPEPATSLFAQALALLERVPGVSMACVQQRLERDLSSSMDHLTHPWAPLPAGMSMGETSGRDVSQTQPNASAEQGQGVTAAGGVGAAARPGNHRSVVRTVNSTEFAFGPFGRWRISVEGRWVDAGDGASAEAWFESFRLAPLELLGLPLAGLPEVRVPVPPLLRASSEWRTTYLDGQLRIGRSSQGGVFLFQKL